MPIISNSNAAKAKHLMGSYSSRGAGVSSGKVSQFYKDTFLQEGDKITNLYYAGRVGSMIYTLELEEKQILPFEKAVVTFHETSPSGLSEIITFGIKISAEYDDVESMYTNYSADLCYCYGDELDPLEIVTLTGVNIYSNIFAKLVEADDTTYLVTKIHDREWCDALFSKKSLYYGMNGINYLDDFFIGHNRFTYDPFFEYNTAGTDPQESIYYTPARLYQLSQLDDTILFNEKFLHMLVNNPDRVQAFIEAIYKSAEKGITSDQPVNCLVYETVHFDSNYDNHYPCLRISINIHYNPTDGWVTIWADFAGYQYNNILIDERYGIASINNGHVHMYRDYLNEYNRLDDFGKLYFSFLNSNPFFVNACYGFVTISRFSSTIYSTYVYTAGRGPITDPITDANMAVPISVLNLIEDTSLGAPFIDKDGATFLPLLILNGSGLPSEHPFYGAQVAMTAIDSHFNPGNIPIYNFASYSPSIGSVLVNVKYVSAMFEIISIQINGTSTPIKSLEGVKWEVLFVTRPANITI